MISQIKILLTSCSGEGFFCLYFSKKLHWNKISLHPK